MLFREGGFCKSTGNTQCGEIAVCIAAFRDDGLGQLFAAAEAVFLNLCDTVGDGDGSDVWAVAECEAADRGDPVGNLHMGIGAAVIAQDAVDDEPIVENGLAARGYGFGNSLFLGGCCSLDERKVAAAAEHIFPKDCVFVNGNLFQTNAVTEGQLSNKSDAVGDGEGGKSGASAEGAFPDGGETLGNGDCLQCGAVPKCGIADGFDRAWDINLCEGGAVLKGPFLDGGDALGEGDAFQRCTAFKGCKANDSDAVGEVNLPKPVTALKSGGADFRNPLGEGDGFEGGTSCEGRVADGGDPLGNSHMGMGAVVFEIGAADDLMSSGGAFDDRHRGHLRFVRK